MKITKLRLKEIIKEEINKADPKLLAAIGQLTSTIEDLDISMDFLAAAVTGEEAYSVGYTQKMGGRVANPEKNPRAKSLEEMIEEEIESLMAEDDDWIQKAVDPDHEGDCTPMTKKTCTPARKALAKRFKKAAKKKEKQGGTGWQGKV